MDFFGSGRVIPTSTRLKFLPLGTMGTHLKFLPSGTRRPRKLATIVFTLNPKLYYSRSIVIVIWAMKLCLHFCSLTNNSKKNFHKGSRLEKLDKLDKPKDPKPNPAIEKFDHLDKPKDQKPNPQFNK